ncbi:cupin domain-containing protein [Nocardioides sp. LHD-245]|uniref:cupin domain-containing protein n=1 Tax=Nocardioides sp. LHD-245 TaxID=3051387 RepID=UPI0027E17A4F|nr:cupin domain-containing protein [Nocardioides sp. LHD-245]
MPERPGDQDELAVGPRIRALREAAGLSLRKLASLTGLSVGFLSQVENGQSSIALSTLHNVAAALGQSMSEFFGDDETPEPFDDSPIFTLTRSVDRTRRVASSGWHYEMLSARVPGLVLEPMLVYIEPGGRAEEPSAHPGEEFSYVLRGELVYRVGDDEYHLGPGDSFYMRSSTLHSIRNDGTETAVVVSVVTPRHY